MSGHTPGPWDVADTAPPPHAPGVFSSGLLVCTLHAWPREPAEVAANARLIAAAPALLEALQAVHFALELEKTRALEKHEDAYAPLRRQAAEAIRLATEGQ